MTTEVSLLSHLTNSAMVVYGLQYLKGTAGYRRFASSLPVADEKVHVFMSAIGAFGTAIGMHGAIEGSAALGYHIAVSIPPLWVVFHALWDWGQQLALNQIVYALAVQRKEAAPVITAQVAPRVSITTAVGEVETKP